MCQTRTAYKTRVEASGWVKRGVRSEDGRDREPGGRRVEGERTEGCGGMGERTEGCGGRRSTGGRTDGGPKARGSN